MIKMGVWEPSFEEEDGLSPYVFKQQLPTATT